MQDEGVIKFDLQFTESEPLADAGIAELSAWRRILWQLQLVGQDPGRYEGYGYGNDLWLLDLRAGVQESPGSMPGSSEKSTRVKL